MGVNEKVFRSYTKLWITDGKLFTSDSTYYNNISNNTNVIQLNENSKHTEMWWYKCVDLFELFVK